MAALNGLQCDVASGMWIISTWNLTALSGLSKTHGGAPELQSTQVPTQVPGFPGEVHSTHQGC